MTRIKMNDFAVVLQDYLENPAAFEQESYDASLYTVEKREQATEALEVLCGLCFAEHIELVMILLRHGYLALRDRTATAEFARVVAEALQTFADPLADGDPACFLDPSFLLHGLAKPTLAAIILQIDNNGRTIHNTLRTRDALISKYGGPTLLEHGVKRLMEHGCTEDYFGICSYLTPAAEPAPHGTDCSYIAKTGFFLDRHNEAIIVMTMQGQRVKQHDRQRSRDYARLAARLHMDPRAWSLRQVCEIGRQEGYRTVQVIRPTSHPMYIDDHAGFRALYEPVIRQAGIAEDCGCYLQGSLEPATG